MENLDTLLLNLATQSGIDTYGGNILQDNARRYGVAVWKAAMDYRDASDAEIAEDRRISASVEED